MEKISVAIATYNEEDQIGKCLESVSQLADEIVVVDGGSTDKTVSKALKHGAKVIRTENPPIFHINKQKAIDSSTGEWILQLDADEVVTEELKEEIESRIRNQESGINGFWIPRKNYFMGRFLMKGGQYPDYTLRLYKRGKGKLPCKSIHEQAKVEGKTEYMNSPLLHYSYLDFSHYLEHFNRYTDIYSQELKQKGVKISWISLMKYLVFFPKKWFLLTYIRHKGFQDGFPGFVFSLFSSLRFSVAFIKLWEKEKSEK